MPHAILFMVSITPLQRPSDPLVPTVKLTLRFASLQGCSEGSFVANVCTMYVTCSTGRQASVLLTL